MPISLIRFDQTHSQSIELFSSLRAASVELAHGSGESHVYAVHIAPGGEIGPHPAGFDQLFLVVQGAGWVAGRDGNRQAVATNVGAFIPTGELHSKGSDSGMVAIMAQASRFALPG
jgi:quercetin dioxygenase-like cupin family protein